MTVGLERVVYVQEAVLELRELNFWVLADGVYRGSGVEIESIQDKHGQVYAPVLEHVWSVVAEGVATRRREALPRNYSHELRVDAMCLPVRVMFKSWSQCVTPDHVEGPLMESTFWVRYERG